MNRSSKYAKLQNDYPVYAPNPILVDGNYIGNPPDSVYESQGFKSVIRTEMPEAPEGYHYEQRWTETDYTIRESWVLVEDETEE